MKISLRALKKLLLVLLLLSMPLCHAQHILPTQEDYVKHHAAPPKVNLNQSSFHCVYWKEPSAPDAASARWYRAATTLHSTYTTDQDYRKMLILYEAAARKGHYQAIRNLVSIYGKGRGIQPYKRLLEPEKARYWINYGLSQGWPTAFDWLATAYFKGNALYVRDDELSKAYLQKAAYLGVPRAQYYLSRLYPEDGSSKMQKDLFNCAATNDDLAMNFAAINYESSEETDKALRLFQRSLMIEGLSHGSLVLAGAFTKGTGYQEGLGTSTDPKRAQAYREIRVFLEGTDDSNRTKWFVKLPRLNEVLPLPPAVMPPWQGVYSAMSADDAKYYQNIPNPDIYIQEIKDAGLLIGDDYLSKSSPVPVKLELEELRQYY